MSDGAPPEDVERRPEISTGAAWIVLGIAGALSATLILYLNRGTTFFIDELFWFSDLGGELGVKQILEPHNEHLHGTTRLIYRLTMETIGPDYLVFRILGVLSVLLCSALLFELARRRVGALAALAPAIVLLFFGTAWQHVVVPIGFTVLFSIAMGLAALLALERDDRRGDIAACVFLAISLFTFTVSTAFVVGVAISVLLRRDRLRRLWIFGVPLALYVTWWIWAQQFGQDRTIISGPIDVLEFMFDSLAIVAGGLTGVNILFADVDERIFLAPANALGSLLAVGLLVAFVLRLRKGNIPASLWASLGVLLTYWTAASLTKSFFPAEVVRYIYPGAIGLLLVVTDAARGVRIGPRAHAVIIAVAAFSVVMNVHYLREGAAHFRDVSDQQQGRLAAIELAAGREPGSGPRSGPAPIPPELENVTPLRLRPSAGAYLPASDRFGSVTVGLPALREGKETIRRVADTALTSLYELEPERARAPGGRADCPRLQATPGAQVEFELPSGGAVLRVADGGELFLRRFSDRPGPAIAALQPGAWNSLRIPTDLAPDPWRASIVGEGSITVCPLPE